MDKFPKLKGKRQGDYAVTVYILAKEKLNDLYGFIYNIGNYDEEKTAENEAIRIRNEMADAGLPGRVIVHEIGKPQPLLGDDAKYARNIVKVSEDSESIYNTKLREEIEKQKKEKEQVEKRKRELEKELTTEEDNTTLESYSKERFRKRMIEDHITAMEHNLAKYRKTLVDVILDIQDRDAKFPSYKDEWRDHIKSQMPGVDMSFLDE